MLVYMVGNSSTAHLEQIKVKGFGQGYVDRFVTVSAWVFNFSVVGCGTHFVDWLWSRVFFLISLFPLEILLSVVLH